MNIKAKLIEQLTILESIQTKDIENGQYLAAVDVSKVMLDYIGDITNLRDLDELRDDDKPFICPECEEAELEAMMINDISIASGISSEVVQRVLDAQVEVLDLD